MLGHVCMSVSGMLMLSLSAMESILADAQACCDCGMVDYESDHTREGSECTASMTFDPWGKFQSSH